MKKLLILTLSTFIASNVLFASFPVTSETTEPRTETVVATDEVSPLVKEDQQTNQPTKKEFKKALKKMVKEHKKPMGSDREMIILIALCVFLGVIAGHRWYAGKPIGWNILFILTGGGLGIWWLIDLIHIITGNF